MLGGAVALEHHHPGRNRLPGGRVFDDLLNPQVVLEDVVAVRAENVRVSYIFSGLGYIGRPFNPVVTVRVEVRNVTFDFFLLAALFGFENLEIPTQSVTITSEDLSTTPLGVTPDPDA